MNIQERHALTDATVEEMKAITASAGRPVTCRGLGCFGCCKEPIQISRSEAEYIIAGLDAEQRQAVLVRLRRWLTQVKASGMLQDAEPHVLLWRMVDAWCPLLEDGKCVAYARRPLSCRVHFADGDPANCHDDRKRAKQTYIFLEGASGQALAEEIHEEGKVELNHLGLWLAELMLGEKVKSPAKWTMYGRIEGETLVLDCHEKPLDNGLRV